MESNCPAGPEKIPSESVLAYLAHVQESFRQKQEADAKNPPFAMLRRSMDEYLDTFSGATGRGIGEKQRVRVHGLIPQSTAPWRRWLEILQDGILAKPNEERAVVLEDFAKMATHLGGKRYPVPDEIIRVLLDRATDDELFDVFHHFACEWFNRGGANSGSNWMRRKKLLFAKLPRGVRVAYTLMTLEGEILNGGLFQFFGNSYGMFVRETLEDCRLVGAEKKAALLKEAMELVEKCSEPTEVNLKAWNPFVLGDPSPDDEAEMDRLDHSFGALDETEPMFRLVAAYIRSHPEDCTTSRPS